MFLFLFKRVVGAAFLIYMVMIITRVVSSWFPGIEAHSMMHLLAIFTDPYLNFFHHLIPSMGGFNVSPIAALLTLQIAKWVIV